MDDFMNTLIVNCKYTLIGKFSTTMQKVELMRKSFILQTQLHGGVNIAHYNARHVFIDLENELDYNTFWTQQRMTIEGKLMRIQLGLLTLDLRRKPSLFLYGFSYQDCHGIILRRSSSHPTRVNLTIGRLQTIEYENIPPYCTYCRHQGHIIDECNFKVRDEEYKRQKEENGKTDKNKNKEEQEQVGKDKSQTNTKEIDERQHHNSREGTKQRQLDQQK
ncbi:hypothetical protein H5410_003072 [Solanum commersonii]|uniref:DUF4283 domain-containing protein n=1 Tax=Solanum commersonii TaxID=4109 RepID=A0A9J6B408_SOLCO|nr:hypothetical protein H5410_003072 [Solanum commersonii]